MKYGRPEVKDYGNLVALTADGAGMAHLGFGTLAAISNPLIPSGGGSSVAGSVEPFAAGDVAGDAGGDVAGDAGDGGGPSPLTGAGTPGGSGGGGGGGSLPFTGLPAAALAAVGAGLSAAGMAVRKYLSRG